MKCWVCKQKINKASRVNYTDGIKEKVRDVCESCYAHLTFNDCHFVEVNRIKQDATPQELRTIAHFMDCWGNEVESDIEL